MSDTIYWTPEQAAAYVNRSTSYLAHQRMQGRGPQFTRIGRNVRYRKSDLDRWLATQQPVVVFTSDQPAAA
jgi:predicted DNA-binding transcriptional regulator AlpA